MFVFLAIGFIHFRNSAYDNCRASLTVWCLCSWAYAVHICVRSAVI